ncbi:MAG TPA: hypothetical protein VE954_29625 [Oligoflexus sp.]|uniref:amino acid kinase family protein n=1 Tax=Oligoflexus sp. TaxID=1971216 RepID=UPI002D26F52A|nr:hypothetical protein [Oligoflexus sp.]HYX37285.1 hypothetical protein [Oligoflexus sp.]
MLGQVHKFGGLSLATATRIQKVVDIISRIPKHGTHTIVVSAALGVTDQLKDIIAVDEARTHKLDALRSQQLRLIDELVSELECKQLAFLFLQDFALLRLQLQIGIESEAELVTLGEYWSARLLCSVLNDRGINARVVDPKYFLKIDQQGHFVDEAQSKKYFMNQVQSPFYAIVPGCLAVSTEGSSFTLGRNGSDFSAGLIASLLDAGELHIWTDIEGIRSGDPDFVRNSRLLPYLSYGEAQSFIDNSNGVLHQKTLEPVEKKKISVFIRSALWPDGGKTLISERSSGEGRLGLTGRGPYTSVSIPRQTSIEYIENSELFKSSEIVCLYGPEKLHFLVPRQSGGKLLSQLINALSNLSEEVDVSSHLCQIALIGCEPALTRDSHMQIVHECPFELTTLDNNSGQPLLFFVHEYLARKAMAWLHDRLFKPQRKFAVALVGAGNVGCTLLQQIHEGLEKTYRQYGVIFQVKAIANSRKMLLSNGNLTLDDWRSKDAITSATNLEELTSHMKSFDQHIVIIDTTASHEVADYHRSWVDHGCNVVTANKITCSGPHFRSVLDSAHEKRVKYMFETTVGAGLPILNVAKGLIDSGDEFLEFQAVLSGSLSYLFLEMESGKKFSDTVRDLKIRGFTEPDPREDLAGYDVARKLIILAKQFEVNVGLTDVKLTPVLPYMDERHSIDEFLETCKIYDEHFAALVTQARADNRVLRYVARLTNYGEALVGIESLPHEHCFARLRPADNIVQFVTSRYNSNPLIVQGPGAGLAVTAAGLYSDMLKVAVT